VIVNFDLKKCVKNACRPYKIRPYHAPDIFLYLNQPLRLFLSLFFLSIRLFSLSLYIYTFIYISQDFSLFPYRLKSNKVEQIYFILRYIFKPKITTSSWLFQFIEDKKNLILCKKNRRKRWLFCCIRHERTNRPGGNPIKEI